MSRTMVTLCCLLHPVITAAGQTLHTWGRAATGRFGFSLRRKKVTSNHNLLPSCSMGNNKMIFALDQVIYRLFSPY